MSEYSELMGSFTRTGNFPLEANYIFNSLEELEEFYSDPIQKATLHKGLFKIVDDGTEQSLYWVVESGDDLVFEKFSSGSNLALTQDVTATNVSVGNITDGTTLPEGMTFTEFVIKMFVQAQSPTYSITSISGLSTPIEIGTSVNGATGTFVQNQGGDITNATAQITSGFTDGIINSVTYSGNTVTINITGRIAEGNNTITSTVSYAQGTVFTEIEAGSVSATRTILGRRRYFRGSGEAPTTSENIRSGESSLAASSFTYDFPAESTSMWVAIPSTVQITSVTDAGALNADITSNFTITSSVLVDGATTGYDSTSYDVYQLSGYGPFSSEHTFTFNIS